jgi:predicted dehydrogenase
MAYDVEKMPLAIKFKKLLRFTKIYGIRRSVVKAAGRLQKPKLKHLVLGISLPKKQFVSVVGCGQFSFSSICYFIYWKLGDVFLGAYDPDTKKRDALTRFYGFKSKSDSFEELIEQPGLSLLYVVSNHASHTPYAIRSLQKGIDTYIEKPVSINWEQFNSLKEAIKNTKANVYVGYNRPYSPAVKKISSAISSKQRPLTISYFISGHVIDDGHWYRDPNEGTRICGNLSHWLDLTIYLMNTRGQVPKKYKVQLGYADVNEPDDNISVNITTEYNDLINIVITSRTEPFEGINETLNLQCGDVIAKVDDFRRLSIWQNDHLFKKSYWPKDVGHKRAILQPFLPQSERRDWREIELSTALMLHITDMVRSKTSQAEFELNF